MSTSSPNTDLPAENAVAVTPSDSVDLTYTTRAIWVGTSGDLEVVMAGAGNTVVFPGVSGWLPLRVSRIKASNTTASGIVAVW